MMRRVDGAVTMVLGVVLALGALTWVMVTQTRSNPGVFPTAADPRFPLPTPTITGTPPTATPNMEPTSSLDYFLASYQPFERGFLLQRVGEACVYAYVTEGDGEGIILSPVMNDAPDDQFEYCIPFNGLNNRELVEPANALLQDTPFRLVWGTYRQVQTELGNPTGEKISFRSAFLPTAQPNGPTPIVYLPDGRMFSCATIDEDRECTISE